MPTDETNGLGDEPFNDYGLRPDPKPQFKLFEIEGFQLLAALGGSDNGTGYGIRYTIPFDIAEVEPVSLWMGVSRDDDEELTEEVTAIWDETFAKMDEPAARKVLQGILKEIAPAILTLQGKADDLGGFELGSVTMDNGLRVQFAPSESDDGEDD